jgi:hypothetical protein
VRLRYAAFETFIEKFAPNVTRGGIFLPSRELRDVGAAIRFELALEDERVVFAGEGVVTWAKPKGMGVKFTSLDPAAKPLLERLLDRRQQAQTEPPAAPAVSSAAPAAPVNGVHGLPRVAPVPAVTVPPVAAPPAATQAAAASVPAEAKPRSGRGVVWLAVLGALAAGAYFGRGRLGFGGGSVPEAARTASPPPVVEPIAPPPVVEPIAAPAPPPPVAAAEAPPTAEVPPTVEAPPAREAAKPAVGTAAGLRIESLLVGPEYKRFTCPDPTDRFSVRKNDTVNVCLQIEHKPRTDRLALVWERNGAFYGKTSVEVPATRPSVHTRAHMKIGESRIGSWSVRVVSERNVTLAETKFEIVR